MLVRRLWAAIVLLAGLGIVTLVLTPTEAQTSRKMMNLQGRLTDTDGNPTSGDHLFELSVWDSAAGGSRQYYEAQVVTVTKGIYNILVGDGFSAFTGNSPANYQASGGKTGGIPITVFNSDNLWLEIEIDEDNPLTPRTKVVSAAFAFNADTLDGRDSTEFLRNTDKAVDADKLDNNDSSAFAKQNGSASFSSVTATDGNIANLNTTALSFTGGGSLDSAKVQALLAGGTVSTQATVASGSSLTLNHGFGTLDVVASAWYQDGTTWRAASSRTEGSVLGDRKNVAAMSAGGSLLAASSPHNESAGKYRQDNVIDGATDCNDGAAKYHSGQSANITAHFKIGFNKPYTIDGVMIRLGSSSSYRVSDWDVSFSDGTAFILTGADVCLDVPKAVSPPINVSWVQFYARSAPSYTEVAEIEAYGGTRVPVSFRLTQDANNLFLLNEGTGSYLLRLVATK